MRTINEAQFEKQDLTQDDGENGYDDKWMWNGMTEEECVEMATEEHRRQDLCRKPWDEWCDCSICMNGVEQAIEDNALKGREIIKEIYEIKEYESKNNKN
ncbi:MAG: hypothetical protein IPM48_14630 [Saprospiraceae bacterium]|nr:hypothetical protein [Saprospiraceae bacterium]